MIMTEKEKNLADKYLECRDKKEALVFAKIPKLQHQMKYWNIALKL